MRGIGILILGYAAMAAGPHAHAAPSNSGHDRGDTTSINCARLAIVGGGVAAVMGGIHVYQQNGWWKDNRRPFHFREDLAYALQVDKIGHFYGANVLSFLMNRALRWCNVPEEPSLLYGAGIASVFQTYIEIEDGFSVWGFDRVDFAADLAGAWYPVAQHYVPFLRPFHLKFSYLPSENIDAPGAFPGQRHLLMDDYEGQTFWLSIHVNDLLPADVEPYWPDFLAVAVGYGGRDILRTDPYSVVFLSLDYDMRRIIPQSSGFLRALGEALNFVHFPAPAVRLSPSAIWYGLAF